MPEENKDPTAGQNWMARHDADDRPDIVNGHLKWYDENKGYGFIEGETGNRDVFFGWREKENAGFGAEKFLPGMPLAATVTNGQNGLRAKKIFRVK